MLGGARAKPSPRRLTLTSNGGSVLRAALFEPPDQIRDVGDFLLEVLLVFLERLQPLLGVEGAAALERPAPAAMVLASVHPDLPSP